MRWKLDVRDRKTLMKTHTACFIGSEAVDWICRQFNLDRREDAVLIGQLLMERSVFYSVNGDNAFQDKQLFYRFYVVCRSLLFSSVFYIYEKGKYMRH
jgi:hypothetical protein